MCVYHLTLNYESRQSPVPDHVLIWFCATYSETSVHSGKYSDSFVDSEFILNDEQHPPPLIPLHVSAAVSAMPASARSARLQVDGSYSSTLDAQPTVSTALRVLTEASRPRPIKCPLNVRRSPQVVNINVLQLSFQQQAVATHR